MKTTMDRLQRGQTGRVVSVQGSRRLSELGLLEGTQVLCLRPGRRNGAAIFRVRGAMLALRAQDSRCIAVEVVSCP